MLKTHRVWATLSVCVVVATAMGTKYLAHGNRSDSKLFQPNHSELSLVNNEVGKNMVTSLLTTKEVEKEGLEKDNSGLSGNSDQPSDFSQRVKNMLSQLSLYDRQDGNGEYAALRKEVATDEDVAKQVIALIKSGDLMQEDKLLLAQLLADRADQLAIQFSMELMMGESPEDQVVGGELASLIMINGNTADMLEPIFNNTYNYDNKDVVRTVLYGVGNLNMSASERRRVSSMINNYMVYGDDEIKPVALQSLAALAATAGDQQKVKQLYEQYRHKNYSDDVRYSAIEALYNIDFKKPDPIIVHQLEQVANDQNESYFLRSLALQLLGSFSQSKAGG